MINKTINQLHINKYINIFICLLCLGHPLPDPGLPYRRPPPGPYSMGPLPHRPPLPPEPYFDDKSGEPTSFTICLTSALLLLKVIATGRTVNNPYDSYIQA